MNLSAIFRSDSTEVEDVDDGTGSGKHFFGDLDHPKTFRKLARTGMFASRRSVDEEDARWRGLVLEARLRSVDFVFRREPIDGEIVIGIGKA
jgi:hypothetical protein